MIIYSNVLNFYVEEFSHFLPVENYRFQMIGAFLCWPIAGNASNLTGLVFKF